MAPEEHIPTNWIPPPCAEPLDAPPPTAFWNAGFAPSGPILNHWAGPQRAAASHMVEESGWHSNPNVIYQLQGLGSALPPVLVIS